MRKIIAISGIAFFMLGCGQYKFNHPDIFYLNESTKDVLGIECIISSPLDSVEVLAKNAVMLHNGSLLDMYCRKPITQLKADFTTEINSGTGVKFVFRTIMDNYESDPNITFEYTSDGCLVYENKQLIVKVDSIKAGINKPERVIIENYGNSYNIVVGCDTVYYGQTRLPATQHMILSPFADSDIRVSGIYFTDMNDDVKSQMGLGFEVYNK